MIAVQKSKVTYMYMNGFFVAGMHAFLFLLLLWYDHNASSNIHVFLLYCGSEKNDGKER